MAGASFTWNLGVFRSGLTGALGHLANTQALTSSIGEYLVTATKRRFKQGVGPDGEKWKPSFRAQAEGGQTLVDSGRLRNSIGYEATPSEVAVGTNVEYAAIHQFGGEIKPKTAKALAFKIGGDLVLAKRVDMPPRPFIGISDEDQEEIETLIGEHLVKALS